VHIQEQRPVKSIVATEETFRITHSFPAYFYPLLPYFISGIQNVTKVENSNKGMKLFALSSDIQEAI
jgi:hypothetical protein